ncbi:MAG: hypothetical protein SGI87_09350 [Flavobacteriales bacterium]|nr:hypothetical protein [Flavobacteriales bacterium]
MIKRIVIDTNCLIFYFVHVFERPHRFTASTQQLLDQAFSGSPDVLLSIPSIVFVEIFDKWLRNAEFSRKFYYEVYEKIKQCDNIEVRSIDAEIMECLVTIQGSLAGHDLHDKIVLASAMVLECPLVTTDQKIANYVRETNAIPEILD